MPIVDVEIVDDVPVDGLADALADGLGELFDSPPATTWVKVRTLDRSRYSENGGPVSAATKPTFVNILKRTLPGEEGLRDEAARVAEIVSRITNRPRGSVHVVYDAPALGRVAFGGTLVE